MEDTETGTGVDNAEAQTRLMEAAEKALAPINTKLIAECPRDAEIPSGPIELIAVVGSSDERGGIVVKCRWSESLLATMGETSRKFLLSTISRSGLGYSSDGAEITEIILEPEHFDGVVEDLEILDTFGDLPEGVVGPDTKAPGMEVLRRLLASGRKAIRSITGM